VHKLLKKTLGHRDNSGQYSAHPLGPWASIVTLYKNNNLIGSTVTKTIKRIGLALVALILLLVIALGIAYQQLNPSAPDSQAFINGQILTMDSQNSIQQAVLLKGNKIAAVGSNEDIQTLIEQDTLVTDLKQQTMIPGIIDAHGHYPGQGISAIGLN